MQVKNIGTRDYGIIEGIDKVQFSDPKVAQNFADFTDPDIMQVNLKKRSQR
jgi:hypothetical protein